MAFELDEKRNDILNCDGNLLVIGGPGSGKTTIALLKAYKFIQEKNLNRGQRILFLSFSRNARARILQSAGGFTQHRELGRKLSVQTFHAFFLELIRTYAYLLGTPKKITILPPHDEAALRGERNQDDPTWITERDTLFYTEGKITFDRFSQTVLELITRSSSIRTLIAETYPLIIVDEAQDTDLEQWGIVHLFNGLSQLFLLGDLDQQIFDYRPEISAQRMDDIRQNLSPLEINLESQNFRNPDTEILDFALDIRDNTPRETGYKGVTAMEYNARREYRDKGIRRSIGILNKVIEESIGKRPESIAILTRGWKGVKMVSNALRQKNIPHRVQFDETATNLSSRLIACLMEPILNEKQHLIWVLQCFRDLYSASGRRRNLEKYERWIAKVRADQSTRSRVVPFLRSLIQQLKTTPLIGNPARDWRNIQHSLLNCGIQEIVSFTQHSEFLVAFNRGRIIMRDLTNAWVHYSCYADARGILQRAIVEAQLSSDVISEEGINVMHTYKSKGKEFDGVIVFQNEHASPLELRGDNHTLDRSRKLFLVAVTRARHHVLILKQGGLYSPLISAFNLDSPF